MSYFSPHYSAATTCGQFKEGLISSDFVAIMHCLEDATISHRR